MPLSLVVDPAEPGDPWPDVTLANGVRARMSARFLAHYRVCEDPMCVSVWLAAHCRLRSTDPHQGHFVLTADKKTPVIVPAGEHHDLLRQSGAGDAVAWPVTAATAQQIRDGYPVSATPLACAPDAQQKDPYSAQVVFATAVAGEPSNVPLTSADKPRHHLCS